MIHQVEQRRINAGTWSLYAGHSSIKCRDLTVHYYNTHEGKNLLPALPETFRNADDFVCLVHPLFSMPNGKLITHIFSPEPTEGKFIEYRTSLEAFLRSLRFFAVFAEYDNPYTPTDFLLKLELNAEILLVNPLEEHPVPITEELYPTRDKTFFGGQSLNEWEWQTNIAYATLANFLVRGQIKRVTIVGEFAYMQRKLLNRHQLAESGCTASLRDGLVKHLPSSIPVSIAKNLVFPGFGHQRVNDFIDFIMKSGGK